MRVSLMLSKLLDVNSFCSLSPKARKTISKEISELSVRFCGADADELFKLELDSITTSSGECREGVAFAAIKGYLHDGSTYINDAYSLGSRIFVTENETVDVEYGIIIISKNARKTSAEISKILAGAPDERMKIVAVTGTKGKSTVASLLYDLLTRLGESAVMVGTLGIRGLDSSGLELKNTTPDFDVVFPILKKSCAVGKKIAILELSSQALKQYRAFGMKCDYVVFTSFSRDHIGNCEHKDLQDYISSKRRMFSESNPLLCVVNYDDLYAPYFYSGIERVVRCGFSPFSDYRIKNIEYDFEKMRFSVCGVSITTPVVGEYNAVNVAIALAVCKELTQRTLSELAPFLEDIRVAGRFEYRRIAGKDVIIDYAHNENSFRSLIRMVEKLTRGRIIAVFGSVGGRSFERRRALAECAEELCSFSFISTDNPGLEPARKIADEIYSAFRDKGCAEIVLDRREAIRRAYLSAAVGDVILLLGKGHEEYMLVGNERVHFSEREILDELALEWGGGG